MAGAVRIGGKGSVRRKKKATHKTNATDDKNTSEHLKKNKVQASIDANTWVVSGSPQTKKLQDILPGIINQLGPDNLDKLRKLDDDDEIPELVAGESFEAAAAAEEKTTEEKTA